VGKDARFSAQVVTHLSTLCLRPSEPDSRPTRPSAQPATLTIRSPARTDETGPLNLTSYG